ncbi:MULTISPECIES: hypothetical protein [unclassified Streptomyces]|uniref:hypothetical protein n=1 Tax=unclassified Streptomyces TaxID=2593676 RepID=UPI002035AA83|nr:MULTISPECIES: hypothetical protein [unclassified Streptomyces]
MARCPSGSRSFPFEILRTRRFLGGGGYNASLIAELVGPAGSVTCVEIDPYVHARTVRFLDETGYARRVRPVLGDGEHGAPPELVPARGFHAILVTAASNDIPPAWFELLCTKSKARRSWSSVGLGRVVGIPRPTGSRCVSRAASACLVRTKVSVRSMPSISPSQRSSSALFRRRPGQSAAVK